MYRLYNSYSGEHLFTTDKAEYDSLGASGWTKEGEVWEAPTTGSNVYRLYNPYSHDHLYTADKAEYDRLDSLGWDGEGVAFHSADSDGTPVYRLYNPWLTVGTHLYTTDDSEYSSLRQKGWRGEDVAFYGAPEMATDIVSVMPQGETRLAGDAVAWLAVQVASTASPEEPLVAPSGAWSRLDDPRLYNEYAVCDATLNSWQGNGALASCAQAVAMVVSATMDPNAAPMAVSENEDTTLAYFSSHPMLYQEVKVSSMDELKPGDILNNDWHAAIYVGTELAQTKFPGTNGNVFEAHYVGTKYPAISHYDSVSDFRVFRPLGYNVGAQHALLDYESLVS